jgi:hypothetical protein
MATPPRLEFFATHTGSVFVEVPNHEGLQDFRVICFERAEHTTKHGLATIELGQSSSQLFGVVVIIITTTRHLYLLT